MKARILFAALTIAIAGCGPRVQTTTGPTKQDGKYSEDLSSLRPAITPTDTVQKETVKTVNGRENKYVEPKFSVNQSLDAVLDSISEVNVLNGYVDGYTIQIYSGTKKEEALNVKKQMATSIPELDSEMQYVQPNFRVRAGKYYDRMDAQKDFLTIKRHFPNAIVIPERIPIR